VRFVAGFAESSLEATGVAEIDTCIQAGIGLGQYVHPAAAIAAIGSAELLDLLKPERLAAVAAIACGDIDRGFVHKLHDRFLVLSINPTEKARIGGPFHGMLPSRQCAASPRAMARAGEPPAFRRPG